MVRIPFLILGLFLVSSQVQAQLTDTSNVLYANFSDGSYYMAVSQEADGATGNVGISDETPQEQLMPLVPDLSDKAELDPAGMVEILACFDTNAALNGVPVLLGGSITITAELRQGSTIIAVGEAQEVSLVPSMMAKVTWSVAPSVSTIDPAAGNLEWYMRQGGAATGALFSPDCGDGDWSHVSLPILPVAGPPPPTDNETSTSTSSTTSDNSTSSASSTTTSSGLTLDPLPDPTEDDSNTGSFAPVDDKDTPGLGFLAPGLVLALAALLVRRRLT